MNTNEKIKLMNRRIATNEMACDFSLLLVGSQEMKDGQSVSKPLISVNEFHRIIIKFLSRSSTKIETK